MSEKVNIPLTPYKNENDLEKWLDEIIKNKAQAPREELTKKIEAAQQKLQAIKDDLQRCN